MREQEFTDWMLESGYNKSRIRIFVEACKLIEVHEGNLDAHFRADHCRALLQKLRYTANDREQGSKPLHAVPVDRDAVKEADGMKKALKFYSDFMTCTEQKTVLRIGSAKKPIRKIYTKKNKPDNNSLPSAFISGNESYYSQFKPKRDDEFVGRKLFVGKKK